MELPAPQVVAGVTGRRIEVQPAMAITVVAVAERVADVLGRLGLERS